MNGRMRNARVLVIALGSTDDVNPMLAIASTLRRRGHEVEFFTNTVFEAFVRAAGLRFSPVGTEADYNFIWDRRTWQWWSFRTSPSSCREACGGDPQLLERVTRLLRPHWLGQTPGGASSGMTWRRFRR